MLKSKKGFSQIDWTISLSLFLLFVAFTFLLLNPEDSVFFDEKTSLSNIQYNFINDYKTDLISVPIFIDTRQKGYYPFKIDIANINGLKFKDNSKFSVVGNYLVFFSEVNGSSIQKDLLLNEDFSFGTSQPQDTFLYDDNNTMSIPSRSLNVNYDTRYMFETISYLGRERIMSYEIKDNKNNLMSFANKRKDISENSILFSRFNNDFRYNSFFFSNYPLISDSFNSETNFSLNMELDTYNSYYVNPTLNNLIYGDEECIDVNSDYLSFGSNKSTISFIFDQGVKMTFCPQIDGTITLEMNSPKEMDIYFSTSSLGSDYVNHDFPRVYYGIKSKIELASFEKLDNISTLAPVDIRNKYGIAEDLKFSLSASDQNKSFVFNYEFEKPSSFTNVFVKRWDDYLLKEDNTKELVTFSVRVWQ